MTATPFDGSGPMWPRALRRWRSRGTVQLCLLGTGMLLGTARTFTAWFGATNSHGKGAEAVVTSHPDRSACLAIAVLLRAEIDTATFS